MSDNVNKPSHYTYGKYEVIEVLQDWFPDDPLMWQVGKYIARYKRKGKPLEDLKKAEYYLQRRIKMLEDAQKNQEDTWKEFSKNLVAAQAPYNPVMDRLTSDEFLATTNKYRNY